MAEQRTAKLISANDVGPNARILRFAVEQPLDFTGGQYVIVHTGIAIAEGKTAKRAYSVLSGDHDQHHFELAVRRIGAGPGSNFMHRLAVGSELSFTGPWGKFMPAKDPAPSMLAGRSLVVTTDTGVTAAMGLLSSTAFRGHAPVANVYWLRESDEYFVPERFVQERIGNLCHLVVQNIPPVASTDRVSWLGEFLRQITENDSALHVPQRVFLAGDGMLVFAIRNRLTSFGVSDVRIETFFNHQERKAEVQAVAS